MTTDKQNQFGFKAEVVRCHACAAKDKAGQRFQKDGGDAAGAMTRFTKYPRT